MPIESPPSKERISELRELLYNLERRIAPLEWDTGRHQINDFKKMELTRLKGEHLNFLQELHNLEEQPPGANVEIASKANTF